MDVILGCHQSKLWPEHWEQFGHRKWKQGTDQVLFASIACTDRTRTSGVTSDVRPMLSSACPMSMLISDTPLCMMCIFFPGLFFWFFSHFYSFMVVWGFGVGVLNWVLGLGFPVDWFLVNYHKNRSIMVWNLIKWQVWRKSILETFVVPQLQVIWVKSQWLEPWK